MIGVLFSEPSSSAGRLVLAALQRSVSALQARPLARAALFAAGAPAIVVAVDVPDAWGEALVEWIDARAGKLVVFGRLPQALARRLGCTQAVWPEGLAQAARSASARSGRDAQSAACVCYGDSAALLGGRAWERPFERFDFTDEWNNLGYGAIRADGSIWALSQPVDVPPAARLASVEIDGASCLAYAALWERARSSVLWYNRAVGPCDSFEWRLVENFLSAHRAQALPCQPVLSEVPWGYDAAITSRLDCDEDIESARELWQVYQRLGVPFSLAIHTSNLRDDTHYAILREFAASAGTALLSHTATHAPNWGGSYEAALAEGAESMRLIEEVTGQRVRYAVSPFHQSPDYALRALCDVGYAGCVGGIIRNDPEFLIARGGALAGLPDGFVGHSQQTMLHGDCMLESGDALAVFKEAFDLACESRTLFGYLDHPFSPRYQYGWPDEAVRSDAHEQLIAYIRARAARPIFLDENAALDFLAAKASLQVVEDGAAFRFVASRGGANTLPFGVEYRGECMLVTNEGLPR
ncbi:polysaccharide deacetylase family protein [Paraburkholderia sp. CNPSo 3076]|uniref:polysaccharide deacetylase family protein n=1 Tax=Paraburkholderia sp. CNPSo 3076 TaxID=2940936 RepID=UPI0022538B69|nr:polysaccharide deacetylase family protein [Paraburkholderia sp. CNPSo 3076]MCX5539968.1 polysaccharide deacetylase family protein [Paraburkholderia sp. CNPSo 3076]